MGQRAARAKSRGGSSLRGVGDPAPDPTSPKSGQQSFPWTQRHRQPGRLRRRATAPTRSSPRAGRRTRRDRRRIFDDIAELAAGAAGLSSMGAGSAPSPGPSHWSGLHILDLCCRAGDIVSVELDGTGIRSVSGCRIPTGLLAARGSPRRRSWSSGRLADGLLLFVKKGLPLSGGQEEARPLSPRPRSRSTLLGSPLSRGPSRRLPDAEGRRGAPRRQRRRGALPG